VELELSTRKSFTILALGSLRRRVAFSLAAVRLILVPVIFLAVFYLFRMGLIVDRIVNLDAPVARLAEQSSVAMLEARRTERNYFLLHDAAYLNSNAQALTHLRELLVKIRDLDSGDRVAAQEALEAVDVYERQFGAAAALTKASDGRPVQYIQSVVRAYETNLNEVLRRGRRETRVQLVTELRGWADSFDADLARTVEARDPNLRQVTLDLQASSEKVLHISSNLETLSWSHIQQDHGEAQTITHRAKWILSVVSGLTLLLSIWISFFLPQRVIKPLIDLKDAVDHAAAGNYEIEFDLRGEGEVVDLANSVRNLILHLQERSLGHVQS
jgi:CHASE3 domain sensor protein